MIKLGHYVRHEREKAGLSLRQLGLRVRVSKQYLYCIEMGEVCPTAALCVQIAHALCLDSDVVLILAGHTPTDILMLLQENPRASCAVLRRVLIEGKS